MKDKFNRAKQFVKTNSVTIATCGGAIAGVTATIYYQKKINFPDITIVTEATREKLAQEMLEQGYLKAICTCPVRNHEIIIAANA